MLKQATPSGFFFARFWNIWIPAFAGMTVMKVYPIYNAYGRYAHSRQAKVRKSFDIAEQM